MIKKLQKKFIRIAALSVAIVMAVLLVGLNAAAVYQMNRDADSLLRILSDNNGTFPDNRYKKELIPQTGEDEQADVEAQLQEHTEVMRLPEAIWNNMMRPFENNFSPETKFRTRYFSIFAGDDGTLDINIDNIAAVSREGAGTMAEHVLLSKSKSGYSGNYRYMVTEKENGKLIIFLDCEENIAIRRDFAVLSVIIGIICLTFVVLLVTIFSKRAISPVIDSMEKQKRFITDAGHEIKTPLAIISANTEVIEMDNGESEWTKSIHNQVVRLNELVKSLLELSRLDEVSKAQDYHERVNFSEAVETAVDAFAALMQTRGIECSESIEENVLVSGNERELGQLVMILMDNAVKYCSASSVIEVRLELAGRRAKLSVYNAYDGELPANLGRLFDRFYRADESRARETGGYGIGLSVAQAVVQSHKGRIYAEKKKEGVCFNVILPAVLVKNM